MIALTQALQAMRVSENVFTDHVQATFKYYKNVRDWDDYETACGRERLKVERRRRTIIAECLKEFDVRHAADRERTVWSWHPLYHMCAINRHLEERLPPLLWNHSANKAVNFHKALSYEKTPTPTKPTEARLLSLYMAVNGIYFRHVVSSFPISNTLA